mmetsp:Transcript_15748/g.22073  ORF Transcript_15748/g.22073 Transcript_15748/m.22073 type:complete len:306 (-) Transcript_15748:515-1432(-)|eukprot:CAMPEP_0184479552 /NCGR_PEP_ID=MMETSP0113_2-20130426/1234_1 /TAXON_ID=91329 /ORGANISM="Norrisiella sphaerica, Strain BC52" /LENGTH=305 /DNA_ID=CAMNT_0026857665 /DNA_START=269 /DNA_END=1186 /DNA_ORIENTATION=+
MASSRIKTCYFCMKDFHVALQATFMYLDHHFCSESCRDAQIKVDTKIEKVQENIESSKCIQRLNAIDVAKHFKEAFITSHDGTEYMRRLGVKSVLACLSEEDKRNDLVGKVLAGYVRWERSKRRKYNLRSPSAEHASKAIRTQSDSSDASSSSKLSPEVENRNLEKVTAGEKPNSVISLAATTVVSRISNRAIFIDTTRSINESNDSDSDGEKETHAALMCFKTGKAMEIMLCDESVLIPENLKKIEVCLLLSLRKQRNFQPKMNLKQQLKCDRTAGRYLNKTLKASNQRRAAGEVNTCQVCSVM